MKKVIIIALGLLSAGTVGAQEYKLAKSSGRLEIREVNNVSIEGYSGNEIIFTSRDHNGARDERAQGLRAISSMGLEDNTGIGLSVVDKGEFVEVHQLKKMGGPDITIKVPKGVKVVLSHSSPHGDEVQISNFEGAVQVSTVHSGVNLMNLTGPMEIKTVHGDIEASLGAGLSGPISLTSVHGHVDVAFPVALKANLRLSTSWGEIFVDPDFKIEIDRAGEMIKYSDKLRGKLNGGGIDIELSSAHSNVYLRKK